MNRPKVCRFIIISLLVAAFFLQVFNTNASAIEYGGMGGRPAYPREENPRTQSIFIHTLNPGESVDEGVVVINNNPEEKTLLVYATDSTPSTGGAFACKQLVEEKDDVGAWITLDKSEVTLGGNTNELVNFKISVPQNASVGEHNGCIVIQEKIVSTDGSSGVNISFRTALRVVITIPGELVRKLAIEGLRVSKKGAKGFLLTAMIRNEGNVSIDAMLDIKTQGLLGREQLREGGQYSVLRGETLEVNFEQKKPFWGGIYKSNFTLEYDENPEAMVGINTGEPLTLLESPTVYFFSFPEPTGLAIEIGVCILLILVGSYFILIRKRKKWIEEEWVKYKVKKGENINTIARRRKVPWKLIVIGNNLKPPYQLRAGSLVKLPPFRGSKMKYTFSDIILKIYFYIGNIVKNLLKRKPLKSKKRKLLLILFILLGMFYLPLFIKGPLDILIKKVNADIIDLVVTSCDVDDVSDPDCYNAISADGGTSYALAKNSHIDAPFQTLPNDAVASATLYYDSWGTLSGTWGIYVKDARDGTTICSVDPAPENASETTDNTSCPITSTQASTGVWLYIINNDSASPESINLDYVRLNVDYTPPSGTLTVDIVDSGGSPVGSPSVTMNTTSFSFDYQTATGTFGTSSEKVRIDNSTANPQWTLTVAANGGSTDFWDGTTSDYDFNDPTANAEDGGDADSLGGQMTINPSIGTLTPKSGCTNTGLTLGSSSAFSEGVTDTITLVTAGATAGVNCYWDLTGVGISQTIPAEQPAINYSIPLTVTVTAV